MTAIFDPAAENKQNKQALWLDAVLCGYAAGIGQRAILVILAALHSHFSPTITLAPLDSFCDIANVPSPSVDCILDALTTGLQALLITGIAIGFYAKYFRGFRQYLFFAVIISLLLPSTEKYWQNYLLSVVGYLAFAIGSWILIAKFARKNFLAIFW